MSKNRRIAKAYIRLPTVIIDGSQNGFDGYRVGLNGFEDPFKDSQTDRLMSQIGKVVWEIIVLTNTLPIHLFFHNIRDVESESMIAVTFSSRDTVIQIYLSTAIQSIIVNLV